MSRVHKIQCSTAIVDFSVTKEGKRREKKETAQSLHLPTQTITCHKKPFHRKATADMTTAPQGPFSSFPPTTAALTLASPSFASPPSTHVVLGVGRRGCPAPAHFLTPGRSCSWAFDVALGPPWPNTVGRFRYRRSGNSRGGSLPCERGNQDRRPARKGRSAPCGC